MLLRVFVDQSMSIFLTIPCEALLPGAEVQTGDILKPPILIFFLRSWNVVDFLAQMKDLI